MKIAFGYKMRSGKDTAVDYLINKYGGEKITFAEPLYESLFNTQKIFKIPQIKNRKYLQIVGDWARNIDEDIFVKLALNNINDSKNYFCNDLRFLNEFNELKKTGWICVKIIRNKKENTDLHKSENELDIIDDSLWNYIIYNNGSINDFYMEIENIIRKIK